MKFSHPFLFLPAEEAGPHSPIRNKDAKTKEVESTNKLLVDMVIGDMTPYTTSKTNAESSSD